MGKCLDSHRIGVCVDSTAVNDVFKERDNLLPLMGIEL